MKCLKCGQEIPDGCLFCPECGAKLENAAEEIKEKAEETVEKVEEQAEKVEEQAEKVEEQAEKVEKKAEEAAREAENAAGQVSAEEAAFCSNCGAKLESGAAFCLKCGAKVGASPKMRKPLNKKLLVIGACAALVLIVAVILIIALAGGGSGGVSSPEKAAENALKATYNGDVEAYYSLTATPVLRAEAYEYDKKIDENTSRSDLISILKENQTAKPEIPEGLEWSIKSVKVDKDASVDTYKRRVEGGTYYGKFLKDEVQEYAIVECEVEISMAVLGSYTQTMKICCIKVDGAWYVLEGYRVG